MFSSGLARSKSRCARLPISMVPRSRSSRLTRAFSISHQRLLVAQHLLETTDASIDRVSEDVGRQTAATLRHHFRARFGVSPASYRERVTTLQRRADRKGSAGGTG